MQPLPHTRLGEYDEVMCRVGSPSTIRVKKVGYSVPARLSFGEHSFYTHWDPSAGLDWKV